MISCSSKIRQILFSLGAHLVRQLYISNLHKQLKQQLQLLQQLLQQLLSRQVIQQSKQQPKQHPIFY